MAYLDDEGKTAEDSLEVDERTEQAWIGYLRDFEKNLYQPVFHQFGFTLPEAFIAWQLNRINNNVIDVEQAVKDG